MRTLRWALPALALLYWPHLKAIAPPPRMAYAAASPVVALPGVVTGKVMTSNKQAPDVPCAVFLYPAGELVGPPLLQVTSGPDGDYTFPPIAPGNYTVRAASLYWFKIKGERGPFELKAGGEVYVVVVLK
jgi:hypothetical protein